MSLITIGLLKACLITRFVRYCFPKASIVGIWTRGRLELVHGFCVSKMLTVCLIRISVHSSLLLCTK